MLDTEQNGFSYSLSVDLRYLIAHYSTERINDMKDILHSHKNSVTPANTLESKLEATPNEKNMDFTSEQRHQMIAEAAYRRALTRNYVDGNPENDWYEAEAEIGQLFSRSTIPQNEPQH